MVLGNHVVFQAAVHRGVVVVVVELLKEWSQRGMCYTVRFTLFVRIAHCRTRVHEIGAEHRSSVVAIALIASALIQAVDNAGPENLLAIRAGRIALGTDADADSKVK